jgi:hypothetical protein
VTTASPVVTRRRALLAGAAALVAGGCGPDGASRLPAARPALEAQLRAQAALVAAYRGLRGRDVSRMAAQARAGAARLRAAGAQGQAASSSGAPSLRRALAATEAALAAHVASLGTGERRTRALTTELVLETARQAAVLRGLLGADPAPSALP